MTGPSASRRALPLGDGRAVGAVAGQMRDGRGDDVDVAVVGLAGDGRVLVAGRGTHPDRVREVLREPEQRRHEAAAALAGGSPVTLAAERDRTAV